jgi:hypothetical protein
MGTERGRMDQTQVDKTTKPKAQHEPSSEKLRAVLFFGVYFFVGLG